MDIKIHVTDHAAMLFNLKLNTCYSS